jgi:predicted membrane channel-forming protein YqfA (hemolysin III family)
MTTALTESPQASSAPPVVAISGLVFAVLYVVSLVLIRLAAPADPILRNWVRVAMNLVPFSGIAFLWFMATLRNRIGLQEDRFFATVFLGSGCLFVAMLFVAASVTQGLMDTFGGTVPDQSEAYRTGRSMVHALMHTFGFKMAAVFMFMTSTIGLRTAILARWVSFVGYACGLVLLLIIGNFAGITLIFPFWVLLVSTYVLYSDFRKKGLEKRG